MKFISREEKSQLLVGLKAAEGSKRTQINTIREGLEELASGTTSNSRGGGLLASEYSMSSPTWIRSPSMLPLLKSEVLRVQDKYKSTLMDEQFGTYNMKRCSRVQPRGT